ncbi:head-tail connector protein [Acuticoccus kandeliae]|uniref:head-tail connector protein n=1 Tax=Acuticoccus kandeliae TaxID=2073160 RepID=UPI001300AAC9|nr:head-tail connector protein [Acuticoccus kandeliae]
MVAILVTPPAAEPVTRDEAKAHARVTGASDDAQIDALVTAARIDIENRTGRALVTQGWRIVRDGAPKGGIIRLGPAPIQSVDAVTVYGDDGMPVLVSSAEYEVDLYSAPGRLRLASGRFWGARAMNGIEVDVTAGYGDPDDVPGPLKQAILMLVAYWYEQREAALVGAVSDFVACGITTLTAPYRMPRLA